MCTASSASPVVHFTTSCCLPALRSGRRSLLSPLTRWRDPLRLALRRGGGVTSPHPTFEVQLLSTVGLLLHGAGGHISEGASPPLFHGHPSAAALTVSIGGMDLGWGGDIICVFFFPDYDNAQRETLAMP
jgi:hypothetical protein